MQKAVGETRSMKRAWAWCLVLGLFGVAAAPFVDVPRTVVYLGLGVLWVALLVRLRAALRAVTTAIESRDHVAETLERRNARWSTVVENSTDLIVLLDASTTVKWVSPVVTDMLGYDTDEFIDIDMFSVLHIDDYDVAADAYAEALLRMEPRSIEARLRHKDGRWRWFEIRGTSLLQDPNVEAIVLSCRDVTARKQAEDALRSSEERFRELTETVREVFYIYTADMQLTYVSPAFESLWGLPPSALYEDPSIWMEQILPEDRAKVEWAVQTMEIVERPLEYRIERPDGSVRWIYDTVFPVRDEEGQIVRLIGTAEDITERKAAEQALREREEFERAILDSLSAQVAVLDGDGTIIAVNKAWEQTARSEEQAHVAGLGTSYLRAIRGSLSEEPSYEMAMALEGLEAVLAGRRDHFSIEYGDQRDDEERWFAMHVSPLRGPLGGAVVSHLDVTERTRTLHEKERLTEQLRQSQKLEAIGRLAGGVAHDFNNILAVIQNYAWFLAEEMTDDDPKLQDVKEILSAGDRAGKLVQQLLTFSRKEIVQPEILDVNEVISDYGKFLKTAIGEDVSLEARLGPDVRPVLVDSGHLGQILTNLAVNARDAMPEGGRLIIETANASMPQEDDPSQKGCVLLKVSDTGCGMSSDVLAHVFEPFFTTKARGQGTGLGLATVYGIVTQVGGRIEVDSTPDEGTSFLIFLPLATVQSAEERVAARQGGR